MTRSGPAFETSTADAVDWRDEAECSQIDDGVRRYESDLWFPAGKTGPYAAQIQEAVEICWDVCPVRDKCDEFAEMTRQDAGIWGGLSEDDRKKMRRKRSRERWNGSK